MRHKVHVGKVEAPAPPVCPAVEALVSAGDVLSIERSTEPTHFVSNRTAPPLMTSHPRRIDRQRAVVEWAAFGQYTGWRYGLRYLDTNVFEIVTQAELRRRLTLTPEQVERVQRAIALYMGTESRTAA